MQGKDVREVFGAILPTSEVEKLADELGVIERERKLQLVELVRSIVLETGTPNGGVQADIMRAYLENEVPTVTRPAFYGWFHEPLERLMERLAHRALKYAYSLKVDLPSPLDIVSDWYIVDSSTVKLSDTLVDEFQGTGDYAAIKVHKKISVGRGSTVKYHFSPAREHDSIHLVIDETWRGCGLLADLAYVSLDRLNACDAHGVYYDVRLKDNWKPRVQSVGRGEVTRTFCAGADFDVLLNQETILLDGKAIDLDVEIGRGKKMLKCRLVGVPTPKGYCFFLTNLPPRIGPLQVGDIYRVRWEIEINNKHDKSVNRLDESDAERPCSLKTLLHASLIASVIATALTHKHNLETLPTTKNGVRTKPPLHPMLLARMLAQLSMRISAAMELKGKEADRAWEFIASRLVHMGQDPNWRRRPSVLDKMRGWKVQSRPLAKRSTTPVTEAKVA